MSSRATQLHDSEWHGVLFVTGGGSQFLAEVLSTPGASSTVIDAQVPYSSPALEQLLGRAPDQAVAADTARQLAMAAYQRAAQLSHDEHLFGLGCSAALGTNRVRRGSDRAHWAIQTAMATYGFECSLEGNRQHQEAQLNDYLWASLHTLVTGITPDTSHRVVTHSATPAPKIAALLEQTPNAVCIGQHDGKLLMPGSFNPLHAGHLEMMRIGEQTTGQQGAFEIAIRNADKPSIDFISLQQRQAQFTSYPLWLTNTAHFSDKAKLFPGTTFLVGADTLQRIAELRFYQHSADALDEAMRTFEQQNTQFLVFDRQIGDQLVTLADLTLPSILAQRCEPIIGFRNDVSSTQLRQQPDT